MQKASAYSSKKDISHLYEKATTHDVTCVFDAESSKTGDIELRLDAKINCVRTQDTAGLLFFIQIITDILKTMWPYKKECLWQRTLK